MCGIIGIMLAGEKEYVRTIPCLARPPSGRSPRLSFSPPPNISFFSLFYFALLFNNL